MDNSLPQALQVDQTILETTVMMMWLTPAQSARMYPRRRRNNDDLRFDHMGRRRPRMTDYNGYSYQPPSHYLQQESPVYGEPTVVIPTLNLPPGIEQPRGLVHLVYKPLPPTTSQTAAEQLPLEDGATKVVCLDHLLPQLHHRLLEDDDFYEWFADDVEVQACEFGRLLKIVIPRPNVDPDGAIGKVFLQYVCLDAANVCKMMMDRCLWKDGEEIVATFYPEDKFAAADYSWAPATKPEKLS
ncbi:unnamed protein product [Alopecurus aequalis]